MIGKFQMVSFAADDLCVSIQRSETEVQFTIPCSVDESLTIRLPVQMFTKLYKHSFHNDRPAKTARQEGIRFAITCLLKELYEAGGSKRAVLEQIHNDIAEQLAKAALDEVK